MIRAGRAAAALTLLSAAALLGACASRKPVLVDFSETPRDYRSKDYNDVFERWTRHGLARLDVEAALECWATYKSWDFREAYIEHYSGIYSLSEADKTTLRAAQLDSFHDSYEFHVTAQSANYKWNDLERRNTPWKVTLVDGLGHELPAESVKLEKLPDPYEVEFFPHKGPFTRTYNIRFRRGAVDGKAAPDFVGASTGSLTLRIASPVGRVEVTWQSG
jgi:hypothetical protein